MQALSTDDGLKLHLRQWRLPTTGSGAARGTVLIVHGLGEHIGRYGHVAAHLNACGWHVAGYDHRGHGASAGPRGGLARDDSLLADLGRVLGALRAEPAAATGPWVLLGHSLGGLIASRYVAEGLSPAPAPWWQPVDALALSSPALDIPMTGAQRVLLAVLSRLLPDLALGNGLQPAWVSRDEAVVAAYQADPLVHDRVTARLVRFMLDAGALVRERAPRWTTPTLLQWAGADRCVRPEGSAEFAARAPAGVLTSQRYDALFHEIFNEPEQARVLADLAAWLGQRAH